MLWAPFPSYRSLGPSPPKLSVPSYQLYPAPSNSRRNTLQKHKPHPPGNQGGCRLLSLCSSRPDRILQSDPQHCSRLTVTASLPPAYISCGIHRSSPLNLHPLLSRYPRPQRQQVPLASLRAALPRVPRRLRVDPHCSCCSWDLVPCVSSSILWLGVCFSFPFLSDPILKGSQILL